MNYWLHRISCEWSTSSYLLDKGYLTIGWSGFCASNIENQVFDEKCAGRFEEIMEENDCKQYRSRWSLFRFLCFSENDIVVVPLYGGKFSIYSVKGKAHRISDIYNELQNEHKPFFVNEQGFLVNKETERIIDLGFYIPVEPLKEGLSRNEYADAKLTSIMKSRQTNLDISRIRQSVDNVINSDTPINLYNSVIDELAKKLLDVIKDKLNPDKFERLIKWYFTKIGASNTTIPPKNEASKINGADADIVAHFDLLKVSFYVQAKMHYDTTSEWGVEQISQYEEQFESHSGEYTTISWVITTADNFSDEARDAAEKKRIRLIAGEEFARMLLDAGITDINEAFE